MPRWLAQDSNQPVTAHPRVARLGGLCSPSSLFPYPSSVSTALDGRFSRVKTIDLEGAALGVDVEPWSWITSAYGSDRNERGLRHMRPTSIAATTAGLTESLPLVVLY
jgi:hypothetical protein